MVVPILALLASIPATGVAQLSGGSFGGGGGGSSFGSGGGSSFGSGSSSYGGGGESFSDRMARERREREARQRAEREAREARRRAEEAARRAEEERQRLAELQRQRELAEDRALPPAQRARVARRFPGRLERPDRTWVAPDHQQVAPTWDPNVRVEPARAIELEGNGWQHSYGWHAAIPAGLATMLACYGLLSLIARRRRLVMERVAMRRGLEQALVGQGRARRASCEIRRISLGFDWSQRQAIQRALAAMAQRFDLRTAQGMHAAATEAAELLMGAMESARYGAFQTFGVSQQQAERKLYDLAQDLKARYRHDMVRGSGRTFSAEADEGEGLVVVSFVVGATRRLAPLPDHLDRAALVRALQSAVRLSPADLVALEVVWSPAAEDDRMSSLELEAVYPELLRLDGDAPLGRKPCGHCGAVFAAELGRCPACGAG